MTYSTPRVPRRIILILMLAAQVVGVAAGQTTPKVDVETLISRIEAPQHPNRQGLDALTLQEIMRLHDVPGLSIAVINSFAIHWAKGYGTADVESGRPVVTSTLFQAASISKPVSAMAALRMAQDHRLDLDGDVNGVLKSWRIPRHDFGSGGKVTPRAIYSHTSGADDSFGFPGYDPAAPRPTIVQILDGQPPSNVGKVLFARPPFQSYKYSGGGIMIMQLALEEISGRPFAEIMQSTVLRPLEMTNSTYEQPLPARWDEQAARAHNGQGKRMPAPWHDYPEQAAAGLWTTASDLARFVIEIQSGVRGPTGRVLSQSFAQEMVAPVGVGPYAFGLMVERRGEGWYFTHPGSNWGFRADILGHVRKGYGVVIMTNGDNGVAVIKEIEARVAAAYNWDSLDKPVGY